MLNSHTFHVRYLEYIRINGFLEFPDTKIHSFSEQFEDFRSTIGAIDAMIRFKLCAEHFFPDEHIADCVIFMFKTLVPEDEFQQRLLDFKKGGRYSQSIFNEGFKKYSNSIKLLDFIFFDAENWEYIQNEKQVSLSNEAHQLLVVREIDEHLFTAIEATVQNTSYLDPPKPHQFELNPVFKDSNFLLPTENFFPTENDPSTQLTLFRPQQQVEMNLSYYLLSNNWLP
ncbi:hypothetical protein HK096_007500, partial [Nowakowskiella sp. JEL0078]